VRPPACAPYLRHHEFVHASGVAMASVQALYQLMLEKDRKIEAVTRRVERQQAQLDWVSRAVRLKRRAKR
jgi:hypothetical protein